MSWWRVEFRSSDAAAGEAEQVAFFNALEKAYRDGALPATIASTKAAVFKRGNAEAAEVLVPPEVAMGARQVLEQFDGHAVGTPSVDGFKKIQI